MAKNRQTLQIHKNTGRLQKREKALSKRPLYKASTNKNVQRYNNVLDDIAHNYPVFYNQSNIYLHSHLNWFEEGAALVNKEILKMSGEVLEQFKKDSDSLIAISKNNKEAFLKAIGLEEDKFKEVFKEAAGARLTFMANFMKGLNKIPQGKKTVDNLDDLLGLMNDLYKEIEPRVGQGFTLEYAQELKDKISRYKRIIEQNESLRGTKSTDLKLTESIEGFSVRSLQNNYFPRLVEVMFTETFNSGILNTVGELISKEAQTGTTADIRAGAIKDGKEVMSGYFSVKTNKPKQTKSKIMETFND